MNRLKIKYWDFERAREYVRGLKFKTREEWKNYSKISRPYYIPSNPNVKYKNKWIGFPDWLGYNYKKGDESRKYNVNHNFFKIWSSDMAYIFGFWFADGNISGNEFSISQNRKDIYLLKKIAEVMGSDYNLGNNNSNVRFWVTSKTIVEDVKKLGGRENKTNSMLFPIVPKEYLPDFIRGLWDGDGSISLMKKKNRYISSFTCRSRKFARELLSTLGNEINNLGGSLVVRKHPIGEKLNFKGHVFIRKINSFSYNIKFGNNDVIRLREFIYSGEPKLFLKRKYELFRSAGDITYIKKGFLKYEDAKKIIKCLNIKSKTEWELFCKAGLRPYYIPAMPSRSYRKSGWVNWGKWLGYKKQKTCGEKTCVLVA